MSKKTCRKFSKVAGEWIGMQSLLDLKSERRESAAHVGVAGRQPDLCVTRQRNHLVLQSPVLEPPEPGDRHQRFPQSGHDGRSSPQ